MIALIIGRKLIEMRAHRLTPVSRPTREASCIRALSSATCGRQKRQIQALVRARNKVLSHQISAEGMPYDACGEIEIYAAKAVQVRCSSGRRDGELAVTTQAVNH